MLCIFLAGSYCEYKTTSASPSNTDSFEDYRSTLNKECDGDQAGTLTWTPNETTPDMVYYQVGLDMNANCVRTKDSTFHSMQSVISNP